MHFFIRNIFTLYSMERSTSQSLGNMQEAYYERGIQSTDDPEVPMRPFEN